MLLAQRRPAIFSNVDCGCRPSPLLAGRGSWAKERDAWVKDSRMAGSRLHVGAILKLGVGFGQVFSMVFWVFFGVPTQRNFLFLERKAELGCHGCMLPFWVLFGFFAGFFVQTSHFESSYFSKHRTSCRVGPRQATREKNQKKPKNTELTNPFFLEMA